MKRKIEREAFTPPVLSFSVVIAFKFNFNKGQFKTRRLHSAMQFFATPTRSAFEIRLFNRNTALKCKGKF